MNTETETQIESEKAGKRESGDVIVQANCHRGCSGPDFAIVKLRNGVLLEIGDEGINAYQTREAFLGGQAVPLGLTFNFAPSPIPQSAIRTPQLTTVALNIRLPEIQAIAEHIHNHCHGKPIETINKDLVTVVLVRLYDSWRRQSAL